MRFVFIVEGKTEKIALKQFFTAFLAGRNIEGIGIDLRSRKTCSEVFRSAPEFARDLLGAPGGGDILAVYSLLDLYNAGIFPRDGMTVDERIEWATNDMQQRFQSPRYRHHFAVFETEAWLLSDPSCFPVAMRADLKQFATRPEMVNDANSPAHRIGESFYRHHNRKYIKPEQGRKSFGALKPELARRRCPRLQRLLDGMLYRCAQAASAE